MPFFHHAFDGNLKRLFVYALRGRIILTGLLCLLVLSGCQSQQLPVLYTAEKGLHLSLPLIQGWNEGHKVYYVTTDVSDFDMAQRLGVNYAPRLKDAVPAYPKPPGLKTVLERIYVFPKGEQGSILPSSPEPLGPGSQDTHYSPLWLLYEVNWQPDALQQLLTSEEQLLAAEEAGKLQITRTAVVANCPVVKDAAGHSLGTLKNPQVQ